MKCRYCGKKAKINVQKVWIKWDYDPKTDSYSDNHELLLDAEEPVGDENLHLCEYCFNKWKEGEIK
ncbi:MAG: hypothetical protein HY769_09955 [Candidatus Stahlbacteria bacterium]|nr:hypothetical protein [Candidatus Stahlbacteria bacterium]